MHILSSIQKEQKQSNPYCDIMGRMGIMAVVLVNGNKEYLQRKMQVFLWETASLIETLFALRIEEAIRGHRLKVRWGVSFNELPRIETKLRRFYGVNLTKRREWLIKAIWRENDFWRRINQIEVFITLFTNNSQHLFWIRLSIMPLPLALVNEFALVEWKDFERKFRVQTQSLLERILSLQLLTLSNCQSGAKKISGEVLESLRRSLYSSEENPDLLGSIWTCVKRDSKDNWQSNH